MSEFITSTFIAPVTTWLTILLIALLIAKELISAAQLQGRWKAWDHFLNIAIVPLLVIFSITVALRIIAILPS